MCLGFVFKCYVGESVFLKYIWGGCVEVFFVIICNFFGIRFECFIFWFVLLNGVFISGVIIFCICVDDINYMNVII